MRRSRITIFLLCVLFLFASSTDFLWAQPAAALSEARMQLKKSGYLLQASGGFDDDLLSEAATTLADLMNMKLPVGFEVDSIHADAFFLESKVLLCQNEPDQSIQAIKNCKAIADRIYPPNDPRQVKYLVHFVYLLDVYFTRMEEAILIRNRISAILDQLPISVVLTEYEDDFFNNLARLADTYDRIGRTEEAIKYFEIGKRILDEHEISYESYFTFKMTYLNFLSYQPDLKKALSEAQAFYRYVEKSDIMESNKVLTFANLEVIIGRLYYDLHDLKRAEINYKNALAKFSALFGFENAQTRFLEKEIAEVYYDQGKFRESNEILERQLNKLLAEDTDVNIDLEIISTYSLLADSWWRNYQKNSDPYMLYSAINSSRNFQKHVLNSWRKFSNSEDLYYEIQDKKDNQSVHLNIFQKAYAVTDSIRYIQETLQFLDQYRDIFLRYKAKRNIISAQEGIALELLNKEDVLRQRVFELEYQLSEASNLSEAERGQYSDSLLASRIRLQNHLNEIYDLYPNYAQLRWDIIDFSWAEIIAYLGKNHQTLAYYAIAEDALFVIGISPRGQVFERVPMRADSVQALVDQLRASIYENPGQPQVADLQQLATASHRLYQVLLAPLADIATDRLVVIPDGALEILPFSLLLSTAVDPAVVPLKEWPYALRQYSFSYAYALDLLLHQQASQAPYAKRQILAFAPDFTRGTLRSDSTRFSGELLSNQDEVAYIADQFACRSFTGEAAQLADFRRLAPDYAILHLATHAAANTEVGDFSYLAFSANDTYDDELKVGELYNLHIPAELVVLSACETGLGEWQRGEGIVGLERAFSFAGARSLITTHWKVSDRASAGLMALFYDQLTTGAPKDVALQRAQLAFLASHDNWLAHPFFWAGYVQKGDTAPLDIPRRRARWPWVLAGVLGVGVLAYGYRRSAGSA